MGAEDFNIVGDILYASSDDRSWFPHGVFGDNIPDSKRFELHAKKNISRNQKDVNGAIYTVDLNESRRKRVATKLPIKGWPAGEQDFHPHGMTVYSEEKVRANKYFSN
jgi:hypothetical protein